MLFSLSASAQNKIKVYFTRPVDTSISTGVSAIWLNQSMDDTLVAYINRAKYSIDIAVFSYDQSNGMANIANAINAAYASGKTIRWIYNGSVTSSGLSLLNGGIQTLASPTSANYGLMHNKFVIIDANSSDSNDPIVWTGSCNWNRGQFYDDENNVVIIQDQALALNYQTEFNEMWGSTTATPNLNNSKFGPDKSDNTTHYFTIDNKVIECYFSPTDGTTDHIINLINSADHDLNFGVYTFTRGDLADTIAYKRAHGVQTTGIMDQYSLGYTAYNTLSAVMGNDLKIFSDPNNIYHTKHVIADACDANSDPSVESGSHNWSTAAETKHDENILIIHDATLANVFLQAYKASFNRLNGVLTPCISSDITEISSKNMIYPNPASKMLYLSVVPMDVTEYEISDLLGRIEQSSNLESEQIDISNLADGCHLLRLKGKSDTLILKFLVNNQ